MKATFEIDDELLAAAEDLAKRTLPGSIRRA
jgi:hypothetical protein